uniref:SPOR domain-containing protein n=1 Tax=Eiseniibacteriota bacterium TaxID=2212470 RepID=A0A832I170_UNCEI
MPLPVPILLALLAAAPAPAPPGRSPAAQPAPPAAPPTLRAALVGTPADSLAPVLRRVEMQARGGEAAEAALELGRFHFARGEYRQAAGAFARAAARLDPARKPEARYWQGLSALAVGDAAAARAALDEVARGGATRADDAALGVALAWEMSGRPDRALDALQGLIARGGGGEATPAALERIASLAERLGRGDDARRARERLRREWPASIEAARVGPVAPAAAPASAPRPSGPVAVHLGVFADDARARLLAERARRAGFGGVTVLARGEGGARLHVVRLGVFPSEAEARAAGQRAADSLGIHYRLERSP